MRPALIPDGKNRSQGFPRLRSCDRTSDTVITLIFTELEILIFLNFDTSRVLNA
jgi:hypothetical protein